MKVNCWNEQYLDIAEDKIQLINDHMQEFEEIEPVSSWFLDDYNVLTMYNPEAIEHLYTLYVPEIEEQCSVNDISESVKQTMIECYLDGSLTFRDRVSEEYQAANPREFL